MWVNGMLANINALNVWSDAWATLVVAVLWQSTALAFVVWIIAFALLRGSPAVRYWLWQIVAIKLLLMPLWSWSLALPWLVMGTADAPQSITPGVAANVPGDLTSSFAARSADREVQVASRQAISESTTAWLGRVSWQSWLLMAWGAVVLLQIAKLSIQRLRLSRILRQATPAGADLAAHARRVADSLHIRQVPHVLLTSLDCSPFVGGILRPTLVLSQSVLELLSPEELQQVLAHVKRRDLIWGWLPELAAMLYFFHPVAHLVRRRVHLERELACDQLAMAHSGRTPAEYAETLVRVVSSASRPTILRSVAAAGLAGQSALGDNRHGNDA
jgi:beta-lactamase regulating signal transducer with metallopeptidase domain